MEQHLGRPDTFGASDDAVCRICTDSIAALRDTFEEIEKLEASLVAYEERSGIV